MKTFFTNRVEVSPSPSTIKSSCSTTTSPACSSSPSFDRHLTVPPTVHHTTKKQGTSIKSIARYFFQQRRSAISTTTTTTMNSEVPPCLSTSTSVSSIRSSGTIPKKMSTDIRSSKSLELELLITEQPTRTLRVSLTPDYAA